jgi:hypothetical protein
MQTLHFPSYAPGGGNTWVVQRDPTGVVSLGWLHEYSGAYAGSSTTLRNAAEGEGLYMVLGAAPSVSNLFTGTHDVAARVDSAVVDL